MRTCSTERMEPLSGFPLYPFDGPLTLALCADCRPRGEGPSRWSESPGSPSAGWARPKLSVYVTADSFAVKSAHCEASLQEAEKEPQLERNAVASAWGFNSRILAFKN